jgi:hypothetical protein
MAPPCRFCGGMGFRGWTEEGRCADRECVSNILPPDMLAVLDRLPSYGVRPYRPVLDELVMRLLEQGYALTEALSALLAVECRAGEWCRVADGCVAEVHALARKTLHEHGRPPGPAEPARAERKTGPQDNP